MNSINRNLIVECLKQLSDRRLQEMFWMGKSLPEQSSFTEAVEGLFTDSALSDALRSNATGFSQEIESKLHELEKYLAKVNTRGGPRTVIDDPAMPHVRELAAELAA